MKKSIASTIASVFPFLAMQAIAQNPDPIPNSKQPQYIKIGLSPKEYGLYVATKSSMKVKSKLNKVRNRK